jgi:hypothetical protein
MDGPHRAGEPRATLVRDARIESNTPFICLDTWGTHTGKSEARGGMNRPVLQRLAAANRVDGLFIWMTHQRLADAQD